MEDLIRKYSANLPNFSGKAELSSSQPMVVVLTGSTGGLGSHLLADLLAMKEVAKVYTFDRGGQVNDRQRLAFSERKLPLQLLSDKKLVTLSVNPNAPDLGLSSDVLKQVSIWRSIR